jgi:hypothetical protein
MNLKTNINKIHSDLTSRFSDVTISEKSNLQFGNYWYIPKIMGVHRYNNSSIWSGKNQKKNEAYSNFFHSDGYTCNLFKLFINLHNVDKTQGPLTVVKKEMQKIFKKNTGYNDRSNYQKENANIEHCLHYNTGLKGDVLLCDTTELLHRAGDIEFGKHRDILFLDFLAYPFEHDTDIFHFQSEVCKRGLDFKFAKIVGFKKLFKLYQLCKTKKLVRN